MSLISSLISSNIVDMCTLYILFGNSKFYFFVGLLFCGFAFDIYCFCRFFFMVACILERIP